jgi:hypothetical protein
VPDLQEHIFGLAVEQHCRELMRTQICPGITLAAIKRNQASYVLVEEQIDRLRAGWDAEQEQALREVMTKYNDKDGLQGALVDAVDAFLSSIASLPGHMRCLWMRHLGDVVDQQRLSSVALGRVTDPRRLKVWQPVLPYVHSVEEVREGRWWVITDNTVPVLPDVGSRWRW